MRLEDQASGREVELEIVSYECAEERGDRFDDNWLIVAGRVTSGDLRWKFRDPCLLVSEARAVGQWLELVTNLDVEPARLDFTEPCLAFAVVERSRAHVTVRVELGYEAAPPGSEPSTDSPFVLDLRMAAGDLVAAREDWLAGLARFPER